MLSESAGTGATRLKQSLLAAVTTAHLPNVCFLLGYLIAAAVSHRYAEKRDVLKKITVLFSRQSIPERSILALSAEDSPVIYMCSGA